MSDFHQQAIEDVARAMGVSIDDVNYYMRPGMSSSKLAAYAVAQRERVLELEARVNELSRGIIQSGDWRFMGKTPAELRKLVYEDQMRRDTKINRLAEITEDALAASAPEKAKP